MNREQVIGEVFQLIAAEDYAEEGRAAAEIYDRVIAPLLAEAERKGAEAERKGAKRGWDEGWSAATQLTSDCLMLGRTSNPYRAGE